MANKPFGIVLCLTLSACSVPSQAPSTAERTMRQGSGGVETRYPENLTTGTSEGQPAATPPGYALRERIDREYGQSRIAGIFQDRRDEFMTRWSRETVEWAAETRVILLQIGGPTAKSRFQNAHTPIGMVSGDVGWNNIRNFLRTRLAALESICKGQ